MNSVALTGRIVGEPTTFTSNGFKGKPAYKFAIATRDEIRPWQDVVVHVVVAPVIAAPLESLLAEGRKLDGTVARFECTLTQASYMDPKTGAVAPTVNCYAKSYEIYAFDHAIQPRTAAGMRSDSPVNLARLRGKGEEGDD